VALLCLVANDWRPAAATPAPKRTKYRVEVEVDLDAGRYRGRQSMRYQNRTGDKVEWLRFELYPNVGLMKDDAPLLLVTGASVGGRQLETHGEGSSVRVKLAEAVASGDDVELSLEFEGRAVRRERDEVGLQAHVNDQVAIVLDPTAKRFRKGSDVVTASSDTMLLGNPFPVLAVPKGGEDRRPTAGDYVFSEASDYRVEVASRAPVDIAASGRMTGVTPEGAKVFEGEALRSVAVFVSRGLVATEREAGGMRLRSLHREEHATAGRRALDALGDAVGVYSELFGPAPVREISVVEAPLAPGTSAVAFSGVIAAATAYYTDIRGEEGRTLSGFVRDTPELLEGEVEFAIMREAARQWWGEGVGSDPRRASLLTEGLAGYSAVLATERTRGEEAAARAVEQRFRTTYRVYRMFGGVDLPAGRDPTSYPNYFAYSAIVEAKTSLFFAALRGELGDERFFAALKRYYGGFSGWIARPEDFVAAIDVPPRRETRKEFDRLYDRWIEQRHGDADIGEPEYAVAVGPGVAVQSSDRKTGFERFGRFVFRMFKQIGKSAARPF
jgi:hypothetical protein